MKSSYIEKARHIDIFATSNLISLSNSLTSSGCIACNALVKEPLGESIRKIPGENNLFIFGDLQLYLRLRDLDSPAIISRQGEFMSGVQGKAETYFC